MGNTDSIPVVSQVKSLVQKINGDDSGARKTQENFIRTGIIASQVNSAILALQGHPEEARKVQEEFGEEALGTLEGLPVIGHAMSAGYAAGGDRAKAEEVAIGATKSTVVAGSALLSLGCGPGAPVCAGLIGSAAVLGTNAAWDGVESLVRNQSTGIINTIQRVKDIAEKNETIDAGEVFDIAFEQAALAAGGAFGGVKIGKIKGSGAKVKGSAGKISKKSGSGSVLRGPVRCLCKRSAPEVAYSPRLGSLPPSLSQLDLTPSTMEGALQGIFSVFLILKLMLSGSPLATPYTQELCTTRQQEVTDCEALLLSALEKYSSLEEESDPLVSSLSTLVFDYDNLVAENMVGSGLQLWLCSSVPEVKAKPSLMETCVLQLRQGIQEIQGMDFPPQPALHPRTKRRAACCASASFRRNHFTQAGDDLVVRPRATPWIEKNTRILTDRQKVYQEVADKLARGDWEVVQYQGKAQRAVKIQGVRMVDETVDGSGGVVRVPRVQPIRLMVNQQGQIVHLEAA